MLIVIQLVAEVVIIGLCFFIAVKILAFVIEKLRRKYTTFDRLLLQKNTNDMSFLHLFLYMALDLIYIVSWFSMVCGLPIIFFKLINWPDISKYILISSTVLMALFLTLRVLSSYLTLAISPTFIFNRKMVDRWGISHDVLKFQSCLLALILIIYILILPDLFFGLAYTQYEKIGGDPNNAIIYSYSLHFSIPETPRPNGVFLPIAITQSVLNKVVELIVIALMVSNFLSFLQRKIKN